MQWFADCITKDDVKRRFRELAHRWHPDKNGGDHATMQAVNSAYAVAMARAIGLENAGASADEIRDETAVQEAIRRAVEFACGLPDVDVVIRGAWVWVHGDTKPSKELLKENGFRWAKKKEGQPWYFAAVRSFNRKRNWTMEEIEDRYGADYQHRQGSAGLARRDA